MCELCETTKPNSTNFLKKMSRKKLWDLRVQYHCPVIGTCLTMRELEKVARQSGISVENAYSDYELHVLAVTQAETKSRLTRNTQKLLEKKYTRYIKFLAKCKSKAELECYWREALKNGDIPGMFWTILTHPYTDVELSRTIYRDVHMLSHIQGASNRVDIQKLQTAEKQVENLKTLLSKSRQKNQEQLCRREKLIKKLEDENQLYKARQAEVSKTQNDKQSEREQSFLLRHNEDLSKRLDWSENQLAQRNIEFSEISEDLKSLKELLDETRKENAALEYSLQQLLDQEHVDANNPVINLNGKKVLYVGGRSNVTPHLKNLVTNLNGEFFHHDGGLEENTANLQGALASADLVFCPIDCTSHDACLRAKHHCQQTDKEFIPLRSAGISSFSAGLQKLVFNNNESIN